MTDMRSRNTLITRAVCIALLCIGFMALSALPSHAASNFYIEDYDIEMQVNEDDTYLITETIDVHFTAPSHGIYRVIPYRVTLNRDGQRSRFYAGVRDFRMLSGQPWSEESSDGEWFIRIGDPDRYADEDTTYQFSYLFDMNGDHLNDGDEVYYNMVGTSWEAQSIDHVSFRITFPESIDMNKVGVKTGDQIDVPFESKGDTVVYGDTTENVLRGLTIRAVLPEGYFTNQASTSNTLFYILAAVMAAMALGGVLLWRRFGVDPQIIETEEFYPPEGMSSPEVGYLNDGEIKSNHVVSMLLALADKGYLKITEKDIGGGRKNKKPKLTYEITQLKEYNGSTLGEATFMAGLFDHGYRPVVQMADLTDEFYTTVNDIKEMVTSRYDGELYDTKAGQYARLLRWAGTAGMVALVIVSKLLNGSPFFTDTGLMMGVVILLISVGFPVAGFIGISKWVNSPRRNFFRYLLGLIGWALLILVGLGCAVIFDTVMGAQLIPYLIGMGMSFVLIFVAALCERKTDFYADALGKIRGFKRFLEVAEKERMEMLAEQDPEYFYRNLAFAYSLGVTDVYAKNFEGLATAPPRWYDSYDYRRGNAFNTIVMMHSMNHMMSSMNTVMTSSPSSGGGIGGGSFSGGGGAGGGGGGSW